MRKWITYLVVIFISLNIGVSSSPVTEPFDEDVHVTNNNSNSQPEVLDNYIITDYKFCSTNYSLTNEDDLSNLNASLSTIIDQLHRINGTADEQTRIQAVDTLEVNLTSSKTALPIELRLKICEIFDAARRHEPLSEPISQLDDMASTAIKKPINYTEFRQLQSDEQRLLESIMTNYNSAVRPVLNASFPVNLAIGLTLIQIDVDEKNQVLTVLVWLDQEWTDEKLLWDPKEYNGLEMLRVPCAKLWLPDIVLYNSVEDMREGYMQALAMVSFQGVVFWPPIVKYRGNCEIQIKYFPFDDQVCKLKLGSWAYDGFQVNISKRREGIDLGLYQSNGEWKLVRTEIERSEFYYPCCVAPFQDVSYYIYLERRTLYYVYNIIIPCVMLSILTLLSFWMKPDSGEKINLGLTILLAFSVFMLLIAESMPSTSFHVPIIGIYITSSMCLTSFSVVASVVVANVNHQAEGDTVVPYWIHKMSHTLGRLLCVKMASWEERHCNIRQLAKVILPRVGGDKGDGKDGRLGGMANGKSKSSKNKGKDENEGEEDPLLKRLHTIVEHQEQMLHKQNTSDDWHSVAIVIDRCIFWIYALMMASVTIGCLVIFKLTKQSTDGPGKLDPPL